MVRAAVAIFRSRHKHHQRLIRGGNQTGKSFPCAYEKPPCILRARIQNWWTGKRFNKPTRGWIVGPERTLVRDGPQKKLTAMQGEFGTGTIPLATFAGRPIMVPGGTGSIDTISVAHETDGTRDGISTATFKSFEQGAEKMQSELSIGSGSTSAVPRKSIPSLSRVRPRRMASCLCLTRH